MPENPFEHWIYSAFSFRRGFYFLEQGCFKYRFQHCRIIHSFIADIQQLDGHYVFARKIQFLPFYRHFYYRFRHFIISE